MILQQLYKKLKTFGFAVELTISMKDSGHVTIFAKVGNKNFGETFSSDKYLAQDLDIFFKHIQDAFEEGTL